MKIKWLDKLLDKFFKFDNLATKEDCQKVSKMLDDLLEKMKENEKLLLKRR